MKRRQRRDELPPPDVALVVRGDLLDSLRLAADATDNFEIYGFYGISVFVENDAADVDWITAHKLARARMLALFRTGDLLGAGLELWATGQAPHYECGPPGRGGAGGSVPALPHQVVENPNFTDPAGGR